MAQTKKDFIRAAKIVSDLRNDFKIATAKRNADFRADVVEDAFIAFFRGENPRFDVDRFRGACGGTGN